MPLKNNKQLLLVKIETTFNVDAVPTKTADAILCEEPQLTTDFVVLERNFVKPHWSRTPHALGRKLAKIRFVVEMKNGGSAGVQSKLGRLLTACGFKETIVATTSATYKPSSNDADHKSATIYHYQDGLLHMLTGAFGTVQFDAEVNGYGKATFEFTGQYYDPTDVALPTGPTYETTKPQQIELMQFEIDDYAATISKLSIDMGNEIFPRLDANGADGYNGTYIGDRNVTGGIDPEAALVATYDFWEKLRTAAEMTLTARVGTAPGNTITITAPATQYTNMTYASRDRIRTLDVGLAFNEGSVNGDDEIVLTFT